jgi:hypothetical protein
VGEVGGEGQMDSEVTVFFLFPLQEGGMRLHRQGLSLF